MLQLAAMEDGRTDPVNDLEGMQRKAERRRRRRRSFWLSVLLPFLAGMLLIAALVALAWLADLGDASAWADASLTFLLLPLLLLCPLPFILLLAMSYGVAKLTGRLPDPLERVDRALGRVERAAEQATRAAVRPLILAKAFWTAVGVGWARMGSILRGERGENDE